MKDLWWQTLGEGDYHLVLLHGWGLNAQIWHYIGAQLSLHFTLHLVDLPGFGRSIGFGAMTLDEMVEHVLKQAPDKAVWLGWSLGGLVASQIALTYPYRALALITVASSPCFRAQNTWPGIKFEVLTWFQHQLEKNFQSTIERFLALQTMGTETALRDVRMLKNIIFSLPMLEVTALNGGLEILKTIDLREPLAKLRQPHLRIYGALDGLVPSKIAPLLDNQWPNSKSLIVAKAAHAPFISHPNEFCQLVIDFITQNKDKLGELQLQLATISS